MDQFPVVSNQNGDTQIPQIRQYENISTTTAASTSQSSETTFAKVERYKNFTRLVHLFPKLHFSTIDGALQLNNYDLIRTIDSILYALQYRIYLDAKNKGFPTSNTFKLPLMYGNPTTNRRIYQYLFHPKQTDTNQVTSTMKNDIVNQQMYQHNASSQSYPEGNYQYLNQFVEQQSLQSLPNNIPSINNEIFQSSSSKNLSPSLLNEVRRPKGRPRKQKKSAVKPIKIVRKKHRSVVSKKKGKIAEEISYYKIENTPLDMSQNETHTYVVESNFNDIQQDPTVTYIEASTSSTLQQESIVSESDVSQQEVLFKSDIVKKELISIPNYINVSLDQNDGHNNFTYLE